MAIFGLWDYPGNIRQDRLELLVHGICLWKGRGGARAAHGRRRGLRGRDLARRWDGPRHRQRERLRRRQRPALRVERHPGAAVPLHLRRAGILHGVQLQVGQASGRRRFELGRRRERSAMARKRRRRPEMADRRQRRWHIHAGVQVLRQGSRRR